jgi:predicted Zn-dependent protease
VKKFLTLFTFLIVGSFLMQGFQCASPEMTTAKVAYGRKDFDKAESSLEKEISKNPNNGEAHLMMAEIKRMKNDFKDAALEIKEAKSKKTDPKIANNIIVFEYNLWIDCFNGAIELLNNAKDPQKINKAIETIEAGLTVRPEMANFYNLLGSAYLMKGDTAKYLESNNKYVELVSQELDFAREKSIYYGMTRSEVLSALGTPKESHGFKYSKEAKDSNITDTYSINGKDVFTFYNNTKDPNTFVISGWRVNPPKSWSEPERTQSFSVSTAVFADLASYYFEHKDYANSLKQVRNITLLDPSNSDANSFMVQIYELQGNKDEAVKSTRELVAKNPNNKNFRAQLGDILLRLNKYDEAIENYSAALKLDPDFKDVMRNLAVAYKNKAVLIQNEEFKKYEANKDYKLNSELYFPWLKKAAESFEQLRKYPELANEFDILGELAEIYNVVGEKDKVAPILSKLEGIESSIPNESKERYYLILLSIYDKMDSPDKLKRVQEELEKLKK